MSNFFMTNAPLAEKPAEINNKTALVNKYVQAKKNAARLVKEGYPIEKKFESLEEIKAYLSGDLITCLLCGKAYKGLCGHLSTIHKISADDYKEKYGLPFRSGLQISSLTDIYRARMNTDKQREFLKTIRTPENKRLQEASMHRQRKGSAFLLNSKRNIAKAPTPTKTYTKEDAIKVIKFIKENDCSLNEAIRKTKIMKLTCFRDLLKQFPELPYTEAINSRSRGVTNPIKKNMKVISEIKRLRDLGHTFKEVGNAIGIHKEYAARLHRGARA
ncbi:MAG: MucR family transcriptional regulator [Candidatus Cloacimonetes bacterium]|nr:MucR family transcriptional regulator [Candidatus Cloacimonadota bacterium]